MNARVVVVVVVNGRKTEILKNLIFYLYLLVKGI